MRLGQPCGRCSGLCGRCGGALPDGGNFLPVRQTGGRVASIAALAALAGRFLDPLSLLIVFGGALAAAAFRASRADVARAFAALRPLVAADPAGEGQAARVAVNRIAALAEARGLAAADRARTSGAFLARASRMLSDLPDAEGFERWAAREQAARAARHAGVHAFWNAVADAAPGMGMIGTVAGLVQMFAGMDDPARLGPGMALALLTTLYGVVLANALAGPVAARLERLSAAELAWQRETLARLAELARDEPAASPSRLRGAA